MRYCIDYNNKNIETTKFFKQADEVTIHYNPADETLLQFLELNSNRRINIKITDKDDFYANDRVTFFSAICKKYSNVVLFIHLDEKMAEDLANSAIPFYFSAYCNNWDMVYYLITFHPTDIFIVEGLGFEIDKVSKILHGHNISVRCFANVAQSADREMLPLKKFFVRPEDIKRYEPYIDTIEFFKRQKSLDTLYKIYAEDQVWNGPLAELIFSFNDNTIDSRYLFPAGMERRISCGRRCLRGEKCSICDEMAELSYIMNKGEIENGEQEKEAN